MYPLCSTQATWFYRSLFSCVLIGTENIPMAELKSGRPLLFVSNHPIMAFDYPILLSELYNQTGVFLRALSDRSHWQIPGSTQVMADVFGAVEGNQRNVSLLMHAGQAVLVYPGGARETFKRVGEEKYKLHWGNKLGFARVRGGWLCVYACVAMWLCGYVAMWLCGCVTV